MNKNRFFNVFFQISEKIIRIFYVFFSTYILTKYLSVTEYGEFNFNLTLISIGVGLCQLGFESTVTLRMTNNPDNRDRNSLLWTAFLIRILSSVLYVLILMTVLYFINLEITNEYILLMLSVLLLSCFSVLDYKIIIDELGGVLLKIRTLSYLIAIIFIGVSIYSGNVEFIIFYLAVEYISIAVILTIYYSRNKIGNERFSIIKFKEIKALIKDSFPLLLSSFGILLYMRIDIIMLRYFGGLVDIGIYSLAVRFAESVNFIPVVVMVALYPFLIKNNRIENFKRLFDGMIILSLLSIVGVYILYPVLIAEFFDNSYISSIAVINILIFQTIPVFLGIVRAKYLIINNLQRYIPYFVFSGLAFNIIANAIFINIFGMTGAAIATVLSQVFTTLVMPFFFKPLREITFIMFRSCLTFGFGSFIAIKKDFHK